VDTFFEIKIKLKKLKKIKKKSKKPGADT